MSLASEIIQLFGTSSVPVVIAGTVLGVFELGERFASQRAKDALSKWLLTFDIQKAKALPDGTQELFERIFGERHFSLKCFIRSAAFSVGAITFIAVLCLLIWPEEFGKMTSTFFEKTPFTSGVWLFASLWLACDHSRVCRSVPDKHCLVGVTGWWRTATALIRNLPITSSLAPCGD